MGFRREGMGVRSAGAEIGDLAARSLSSSAKISTRSSFARYEFNEKCGVAEG